jgi:hypothetical protein
VPLHRRIGRWLSEQMHWRPEYAWSLGVTLALAAGNQWQSMHERIAGLEHDQATEVDSLHRELDTVERTMRRLQRICEPGKQVAKS